MRSEWNFHQILLTLKKIINEMDPWPQYDTLCHATIIPCMVLAHTKLFLLYFNNIIFGILWNFWHGGFHELQLVVNHKIWFSSKKILYMKEWSILCNSFMNSLWANDAIGWYRYGSTLTQVMACCLMAPSRYLNQCWLLSISRVLWHNFTGSDQDINFKMNLINTLISDYQISYMHP